MVAGISELNPSAVGDVSHWDIPSNACTIGVDEAISVGKLFESCLPTHRYRRGKWTASTTSSRKTYTSTTDCKPRSNSTILISTTGSSAGPASTSTQPIPQMALFIPSTAHTHPPQRPWNPSSANAHTIKQPLPASELMWISPQLLQLLQLLLNRGGSRIIFLCLYYYTSPSSSSICWLSFSRSFIRISVSVS